MVEYFDLFPVEEYNINKDPTQDPVIITNIMHRFKVREAVFNKSVVFYTYNIEEGERPDHVANKWYGDPTLDWLVVIVNEVLDVHFEWPLNYNQFILFLKKKYGSIPNAHQTVHHYLKVVQEEVELTDGTVQQERTIYIDETTYMSTVDDFRRSVSCFTYEKDLNESRRNIKIIHPSYLPQILREVETIFDAV